MRIDHHPDLDTRALLPFLAARAVPGVEEVVDGVYRRSLADGSVLKLPPGEGAVDVDGDGGAAAQSCGSTRTPRRSSSGWGRIRCSARRCAPRRAAASRATRTRPSSRCGRCSASRSPSPPPARSRAGWSLPPASRSSGRSAASRIASPPRRRWRRWTPRRCRCPAPGARAGGDGGEAVRRAPAGGRAVDGRLRRAALRRRRRVPADGPGREARARGARRRPGARPRSSPRRGARTGATRSPTCGRATSS